MKSLYSVEVCQRHLDSWIDAELALSTGQSYGIAGRNLTRVNLADVKDRISYWQDQLKSAQAASLGIKRPSRTMRYVPTD